MIEARDTGAPQAASAERGRDFWPEEGGKPARRLPPPKVLFGAAGVLVAVVLAAVAAVVLTGGEEKRKPAPAALLPVAYTPDHEVEGMTRIAQRTTDPRPLGQGEVFGADAKSVTTGKYTFTLAGSDVSADCKAVTWGDRLHADLAAQGCTQVLRGSYVGSDKRYLGQFAVFNMKDVAGARQVLRAIDPQTKAGFVLPLNPKGAPAFGAGFSAAYAKAMGHYAVVTWVQRAGGGQPGSLNEVIEASLPVEKPADFVWGRIEMAGGKAR
ncbi:hypothetical protein [Actinomadura hibisca]|uniref:hypothetical protein n=1 Tax=Actinomadura hibisca TaxID=68565 RepID=UPI00082BD941|nr:hypothetical protein [Actinomadura hibisca]